MNLCLRRDFPPRRWASHAGLAGPPSAEYACDGSATVARFAHSPPFCRSCLCRYHQHTTSKQLLPEPPANVDHWYHQQPPRRLPPADASTTTTAGPTNKCYPRHQRPPPLVPPAAVAYRPPTPRAPSFGSRFRVGSVLAPCWHRVGRGCRFQPDAHSPSRHVPDVCFAAAVLAPCWCRVGTVLALRGQRWEGWGRMQGSTALTTCATVVGTTSKR
jgi:hypothetical protein